MHLLCLFCFLKNPRILDDVSFHPSVRFKRWESERVLSFIPPDGNFTLMNYHVSSQKLVPSYTWMYTFRLKAPYKYVENIILFKSVLNCWHAITLFSIFVVCVEEWIHNSMVTVFVLSSACWQSVTVVMSVCFSSQSRGHPSVCEAEHQLLWDGTLWSTGPYSRPKANHGQDCGGPEGHDSHAQVCAQRQPHCLSGKLHVWPCFQGNRVGGCSRHLLS